MAMATAASRVWASPELRDNIIGHMELQEVRKSMSLSRDSFPAMARVLYRTFDYSHSPSLNRLAVPVSDTKRRVYIESVKSLKTNMPLSYKDPHYEDLSEILDTFPLVTTITSTRDFRLTTPPRYLVDAPQSGGMATLHLRLDLMPGRQTHRLALTPASKLRAFVCDVAYSVEIGVDCQIDWDLFCWGRRVIPGPKPYLPAWGDNRTTDRLTGADPPFCTIYNRIIISMVIELNIDLGTLSQHLEQRRQLGYEGIPVWTIRTDSLLGLPRSLFQNPYITSLTIIKFRPLPITIGAFLCLDWSAFRRNARDPPGLRHLHVVIDSSKPCVADVEDRIEKIPTPTVSFPSIFTLDTLTIELEPEKVGSKAIASLPGFSQIAEVLVYLGGDRFDLTIIRLKEISRTLQAATFVLSWSKKSKAGNIK